MKAETRPAHESASAGFSLLEVIAALAIIGVLLAAFAPVYGANIARARTADGRVSLGAAGRSLLERLPPRDEIRPGTITGEESGVQWRIAATPLSASGSATRWMPYRMTVDLTGRDGQTLRLETVRLGRNVAP